MEVEVEAPALVHRAPGLDLHQYLLGASAAGMELFAEVCGVADDHIAGAALRSGHALLIAREKTRVF